MEKEEIAKTVELKRLGEKLTIQGLCERSGVSAPTYMRIKRGLRVWDSSLYQVVKALGLDEKTVRY